MQARSTRQRTHRDTGAHIEAGRRARKRGVCVAESPYVGLIAAIVSSRERQLRVDGEVAPFGWSRPRLARNFSINRKIAFQ